MPVAWKYFEMQKKYFEFFFKMSFYLNIVWQHFWWDKSLTKSDDCLWDSPFFTLHEEDIVIYDGFKALAKEVGEVVKVFDAHALQELNISNEDGGTGPLVHNTKPEKEIL